MRLAASCQWHYHAKMTSPSSESTPLSVLGFTAAEEQLYRVVLRNSGTSLGATADMLGREPAALKAELVRFVAAGLVDMQDGRVLAVPPHQALGRLITDETRRLQSVNEQLDALRGLLPSLSAEHLASQAPRGEPVGFEAIEGGDILSLIRGLSAASDGDLLWLRPDPWQHSFGRELDDWVMDLVRSGRRSRAIYPARVLEEAPDVVRARADAGEHVRILANVPTRLAIMGATAALIPERWGVNDERRLVVRQESMISALTVLFESMWGQAVSVPGLDGQHGDQTRASDRRLLLDQLAGGARDEQIARALGLSLRTVRRGVAAILDELGVESRFQAGVEAVRRGWM